MKKRLLCGLLCVILMISLLPALSLYSLAANPIDNSGYIYTPVTDDQGNVIQNWKAGETYPDDDLYALIDGEYVKVTLGTGELYTPVTSNGSDVTSWTAASARSTYEANTRDDQNIYYRNGDDFEIVWVEKAKYYKNAGQIDAGNFTNRSWNFTVVDNGLTNDYYYNSNGDISTNRPFWHRVYANTRGVTGNGFYVYLWYYKNSETGSTIPHDNHGGNWNGWGNTYHTAEQNGTVVQLPDKDYSDGYSAWDDRDWTWKYYDAWASYVSGSKPYKGGKLYTRENNATVYNRLYTDSTELAWPLSQPDSTSSVIPGSSTWSGTLYYHENENGITKIMYGASQLIPDSSEKHVIGETIYTGPLYVLEEDPAKNYILDEPEGGTTEYNDGSVVTNPGMTSDDTGKVKLNKTLKQGNDGYNLTLESYAVAGRTTVTKNKKKPTDFVVVVDQSGSMSETDMPTGYASVGTAKTLEQVAEGNYYVNVGGEYYRVYGKRDYLFEYFPANTLWTEDIVKGSEQGLRWFQSNTEQTFTVKNQYYYKETSGAYRPVNVEIQGKIGTYYVKLSYAQNGNQQNRIYFNRGEYPIYRNMVGGGKYQSGDFSYRLINGAVNLAYPDRNAYTYSTFAGIKTGMFINYDMYKRHVGYVGLYYRDVNGVEHVLKTSDTQLEKAEYCTSSGNAVTTAGGKTRMSYTGLYTPSGTETRLKALQTALDQFAGAIAGDKDDFGYVDNRVAVVGFSSNGFNNTELLTNDKQGFSIASGNDQSGWGNYDGSSHYSSDEPNHNKYHNGVQKTTADSDYNNSGSDKSGTYYGNALVSAGNGSDGGVNTQVSDAIDALTAHGGTQPEDGLAMAQKILDSRMGEDAERNALVIFFTDGRPGDTSYVDQYAEANDVVSASEDLKNAGYKVYSIGVFGESDGNPLVYPWDPSNDGSKVEPIAKNDDYEYEGGFIEKIHASGNYYYYMRRQWRPDNAEYTENANDTIYDYMSVVSSNYPEASLYIHPDWLRGKDSAGHYYFNGTYRDATEDYRGTSVGSNKYYRMASSQDTLVAAFESAITQTVEIEQQDETTSKLDDTTELRDKINLDLFDVSHATYTVRKVPVKGVIQDGEEIVDGVPTYHWSIEPDTSRQTETLQESTSVPLDGVISASGLNYADEYVNRIRDGYKLVVEISGLQAIKYNTPTDSNIGDASIVPNGGEFPLVEIESPTLSAYHGPVSVTWKNYDGTVLKTDPDVEYGSMPEYTGDLPYREADSTHVYTFIGWDPVVVPATEDAVYTAQFEKKEIGSVTVFADFNASMVLATESGPDMIKEATDNNGVFSANDAGEAVYKLNSDSLDSTNKTTDKASKLTPYDGVDTARIFGNHLDLQNGTPAEEAEWKIVSVLPATNIYYSDETKQSTVKANDQIGYNVDVFPDSAVKEGGTKMVGSRYFQFKGTGIDVYCRTTSTSGTVTAILTDSNGARVAAKSVMNASPESTNARYNAPTISFTGLDANETYTLRIYAADKAEYHLDGIRVYNKNFNTSEEEENATYVNLRDLLLGKTEALALTEATKGAMFFTDSANMGLGPDPNLPDDWDGSATAPDSAKKYVPQDYKTQGPKNEVYLASGQAVGFIVPDGRTAMVSMRVPEGGNAVVEINGEKMVLSSSVDMYYPVTPNEDGVVLIANATGTTQDVEVDENGDVIYEDGEPKYVTRDTYVSLVNVKLTGAGSGSGAKMLLAGPKLRMFAASVSAPAGNNDPTVEPDPQNPDDPTVEPDPQNPDDPTVEPDPQNPDDPTVEPDPQNPDDPTIEPDPQNPDDPTVEPDPTPSENPGSGSSSSVFNRVKQIVTNIVSRLVKSISRLFGR